MHTVKLLPETLGAGCAFSTRDGDGWQDIILVNGMTGRATSVALDAQPHETIATNVLDVTRGSGPT